MELWIRSQDRTTLAKIDKISLYAAGGNINCKGELFAHYETRKRALEVLDEIQKIIINNEIIKLTIPNVNDIKGKEELYKKEVFEKMIYEMPID